MLFDVSAALTACGWAGKHDLATILNACEAVGGYERAAALAAWHGDIGAAVDTLQRGADSIRNHLSEGRKEDSRMSRQYAETLELVSLAIAGYRGDERESEHSAVWRRVCSSVLRRPDLSGTNAISTRTSYIRCALKFLLAVGLDDKYQEVLGQSTLALSE